MRHSASLASAGWLMVVVKEHGSRRMNYSNLICLSCDVITWPRPLRRNVRVLVSFLETNSINVIFINIKLQKFNLRML